MSPAPEPSAATSRLAWLMLPGQRPWRELYWLSLMGGVRITAVGRPRPVEEVDFIDRPYRRLTDRLVEAGALAWLRELDTIAWDFDWIASLELCSLVSGQASRLARDRTMHRAVLVWGNDPGNPLYRIPPYRQALKRSRDADLYLCLIQAAKEHCVALGLPEERCVVVHPGVDTELFHPAPRAVEEPVMVFASALDDNKGIDRVLEAFALVRAKIPEARLMVAGSGPKEGLVRHRASSDGGVELIGRLNRAGVADLLRRCAVFVTAPRATRVWNEQFGLAYVEAIASGLAVVTTICGTNHEAVPDPNLRVPDDAGALAEALLTFLNDPRMRGRVADRNRRYAVEHHEVRRQAARMADAFREMSG